MQTDLQQTLIAPISVATNANDNNNTNNSINNKPPVIAPMVASNAPILGQLINGANNININSNNIGVPVASVNVNNLLNIDPAAALTHLRLTSNQLASYAREEYTEIMKMQASLPSNQGL